MEPTPRGGRGGDRDPATDAAGHIPPVVADWSGARERGTNPRADLWNPLNLLFRPARHFRGAGARVPVGALVPLAILTSAGFAFDRIELNWMRGTSPVPLNSWGAVWGLVLTGAVLAGVGRYYILGWWHHVRVRWSGAGSADGTETRRVFVQGGLVWGAALLVAGLVATVRCDTPKEYLIHSGSPWYLVILVFPFWASWISYKGVRTCFDVRPWPARFWMLALPWAFHGVGIGVLGVVALVGGLLAGPPPDLDSPERVESAHFSASYPSNWDATTGPDEGGLALDLTLPQDGSISFEIYWDDGMTLPERLAEIYDSYQSLGFSADASGAEPLDRIGTFEGDGEQTTLEGVFGRTYRSRVLLSPLPDGWMLEVREVLPSGSLDLVGPGLDLVLSTLAVRSPADLPPDLDAPWVYDAGEFTLSLPGDWSAYDEASVDDVVTSVGLFPPQDATARVFAYDSASSPVDEAQATIDGVAEGRNYRVLEQFSDADRLAGAWFQVDADDAPVRWLVMVWRAGPTRLVELQASHHPDRDALVRPGLELVMDSLRIAPPDREPGEPGEGTPDAPP